MNKPKLLITGVSGFIGQALVASLKDDYEIIGLYEHMDSRKKNPQLKFENKYVCDLRNSQMVEYIIGTVEPEFVIHLAARSEVANSFANYSEVGDINYGGTVAIAEANRKFNPNLKLFVMASTMETYGFFDSPWKPATEETPQRPMAPYAVAKVACEKYLGYMGYAYGFPSTILRQTNSYGRHDNDFFVMEKIITQWIKMLKGEQTHVKLGDPLPMRNFLYIDDLVRLYKKVLKKADVARSEVFVTGPANAITIRDLNYKVGWAFGMDKSFTDKKTQWLTLPDRPGEIYYLNSDPKKAHELLGWKPKVRLDEGIQKTIDMWI